MVTVPAGRKESPLDLSQEESDSQYLCRHYLTQHSQLPRLIQSGSAKKIESTTSWLRRRFIGGKPPLNPKIRARPKTSRPRWIHRKDNSPTLPPRGQKNRLFPTHPPCAALASARFAGYDSSRAGLLVFGGDLRVVAVRDWRPQERGPREAAVIPSQKHPDQLLHSYFPLRFVTEQGPCQKSMKITWYPHYCSHKS